MNFMLAACTHAFYYFIHSYKEIRSIRFHNLIFCNFVRKENCSVVFIRVDVGFFPQDPENGDIRLTEIPTFIPESRVNPPKEKERYAGVEMSVKFRSVKKE